MLFLGLAIVLLFIAFAIQAVGLIVGGIVFVIWLIFGLYQWYIRQPK